ncbi:MAG: hypothetical protein JWR83_434 [Aeromicrobium sp.]|nr:hypothetical protein [Aeromicrobium sp.]
MKSASIRSTTVWCRLVRVERVLVNRNTQLRKQALDKVHDGLLAERFPRCPPSDHHTTDRVNVAVGFATACWIGATGIPAPDLGRLGYRSATDVDSRGRVVLDHRVRAWLGVDDPMSFDIVIAPAADGGLLIVPVDDFARRWQAIS